MLDEYEDDKERIYQVRRMARKLAHNRSKQRVIRKLPRTMVVEVKRPKRVIPVRRAINANKRLTYILLLGASLCAFFYDVEPGTLEQVMLAVGQVAQH
jgi:hypothetical protein